MRNNIVVIPDNTYTPYESNRELTLNDQLFNGVEMTTGVCASSNSETFPSVENESITMGECTITVLSISRASGTFIQNLDEFKNASSVKIDKDILERVASYSAVPDEQKSTLALALQCHKDKVGRIIVITNSNTMKNILSNEDIAVVTYKESGIPYSWTCYQWNV